MEEYAICNNCGSDNFVIYRSSIECTKCAKTYHFANTRLLIEVIDLVKGMD